MLRRYNAVAFQKRKKKMKNFLKISLVAAIATCALNAANYEVDAVHKRFKGKRKF